MTLTTRQPMRTCGKRWPTVEAAMCSKRYLAGGRDLQPRCRACDGYHVARIPVAGQTVKTAVPAETGFSRAVKLAIRTRAGGGVIEDAACEACGIWCGRYGGQCQHIVARGSGGTSDPVIDSIVNGALLCGTPFTGCHGLCEDRDPRMAGEGFWLPHGYDPAATSFLWRAPDGGSGHRLWRTAEGEYSGLPPWERAA